MSKKTFQFSKVNNENVDETFDSVSRFRKYKETSGESGEPSSSTISNDAANQQQESAVTNSKPTTEAVNSSVSLSSVKASSSKSSAAVSSKVGKSFAETFSFLKQTDLFELPPQPQPTEKFIPRSSNSIIVNTRQRGNPILKHVKNVPWEFGDIVPDYEVGQTSCMLFLSLRYHNLNPEYIHERLNQLGSRYNLRVVLVQVDVINTRHSLKELGKICILADCTLMVAWSAEEAGRYLETYKQYEHKPADVLQERIDSDYLSRMQDVLTTVKSINKTDVITLLSNFGSLRNIVNASMEEISLCPGFGPHKARRLHKVLNEPFKRNKSTGSVTDITKADGKETGCKLVKPVNDPSTSDETVSRKIKETGSKLVKPINDSTSDETVAKKMKIDAVIINDSPKKHDETLDKVDENQEMEQKRVPTMSKSEAIYKAVTSRRKLDQNDEPNVPRITPEDFFGNPFDASDDDFQLVCDDEVEGIVPQKQNNKTDIVSRANDKNDNGVGQSNVKVTSVRNITPKARISIEQRRNKSRNSTEQVQTVLKTEHLTTSMQMTDDEYKELIASSDEENNEEDY